MQMRTAVKQARHFALRQMSADSKAVAPPMVYIAGEEMTNYCMNLIMDKWVNPKWDTSQWEHFDLSCVSRDNTEDKVLHDAVAAGARIGSIFKEPTVTPTEVQKKKAGTQEVMGQSKWSNASRMERDHD